MRSQVFNFANCLRVDCNLVLVKIRECVDPGTLGNSQGSFLLRQALRGGINSGCRIGVVLKLCVCFRYSSFIGVFRVGENALSLDNLPDVWFGYSLGNT